MNNQIKSQLNKWVIIAGVTGGALVTGLSATAGAAPSTETSETNSANGQTRSQLTHMTATVTAVDHAARTVNLKREDGQEATVNVPTEVKMFDKLKMGDKVDVDYYESFAVSMAPTGAKPSVSERHGRDVDVGGGIRGREVMISAEVISVDPSSNTVTFKGPHGGIRTIHVADAALQQKLTTLKPGQVVQFDYTQATAASIRPSK